MTTSTWVSWLITCTCKPDDYARIDNLASEMTAYFQEHEPRTTHFEWSITDDHSQVHIHERYADSDQAMSHMSFFQENYGKAFSELLNPQAVVVYGHPSPELANALQALKPMVMTTLQGFSRP